MLDETLLREAEAFANSQTLAEVFRRLKVEAMNAWAETPALACEEREHLHRMYQALDHLQLALGVFGKGKNIDAYNRSLAARQKVS